MDLSEALERIDTIHAHVARGEHYRGYRPQALAAAGVVGLLASLLQRPAFVAYWTAVAAVAALLAAMPTLLDYLLRDGPLARRRTLIVCRQFVPCLLAGMALTLALNRIEGAVALLPGAWALLYGLGTVAALPYLPQRAWLVAAWYLVAGAALLAAPLGPVPPGWAVGVPFGVGHLLAAWVMTAEEETHER